VRPVPIPPPISGIPEFLTPLPALFLSCEWEDELTNKMTIIVTLTPSLDVAGPRPKKRKSQRKRKRRKRCGFLIPAKIGNRPHEDCCISEREREKKKKKKD